MKHLLVNGLNIITGFKILPSGYAAITLFGIVFMRRSYIDAINYLNSSRGQLLINHEKIHILQKKSIHSWIIFYILYIWYFLKLYLSTFNWKMSYKTIPFELESYNNEIKGLDKSNWRVWRMSNKDRKNWYKYNK